MFKRVLGIALAVVMCVSFAACGEKKSSEKVYKIATDTAFPPFEIPDVNGSDKLTGIDIDILAAIAEDQGFKYELDVLGFDAAVVALESNQADGVIAGMSITDKVGGNDHICGIAENAFEFTLRSFFNGLADFFISGCFFQADSQVNNRNVQSRNTH